MSADNWSACPKCWMKAKELQKERQTRCEESYGKVPISEFIKLRELSELPIVLEDTMREDYENYIGESDMMFSIYYVASCEDCGFKFTYEHTEQVDIE